MVLIYYYYYFNSYNQLNIFPKHIILFYFCLSETFHFLTFIQTSLSPYLTSINSIRKQINAVLSAKTTYFSYSTFKARKQVFSLICFSFRTSKVNNYFYNDKHNVTDYLSTVIYFHIIIFSDILTITQATHT